MAFYDGDMNSENKRLVNPVLHQFYSFSSGEIVTEKTWNKYIEECRKSTSLRAGATTCHCKRPSDYALESGQLPTSKLVGLHKVASTATGKIAG